MRVGNSTKQLRVHRFGNSPRFERLESRWMLDSTVVFNEAMYHPTGDDVGLEWIELHNQQAVDMDLSRWKLRGGVDLEFPAGTVISGGGYLVVAAAPAALLAAGVFTGAVGPWLGQLDNGGESLRLVDNDGRLMDELDYGDEDPWPVGPDGSGATLAKYDANTATADPANWRTSGQIGGTPGVRNFSAADPSLTAVVAAGAPVQVLVPSAADDALIGNAWTHADFVPGAAGETVWTTGSTGVGFDTAPISYLSEVLADAPYGYWRLDETTGTTAIDSSGNNRHATFNGGVTLGAAGAPGVGGRATTFNGTNSYVQLPGTWGGPTWNEVTVEAWVNTADPITGDFQSILSGHDPSSFVHFQLNGAGNMGAYTNAGFILNPIVPATPTGQWRHVVMVIKSGDSRVYVDGQQFGSAVATTFTSIDAASNVSIGLGHAGGRWFKGQIDEVAVYNRALTSDRVTAHYNAGLGVGGYTNLIGADVAAAMHQTQASAYLRAPFTIADAAAIDQLQLQVKYDDGFVAYLNGIEVARRNAPAALAYDSTATSARPDANAVVYETINLNGQLGALRSGVNVLAIQGLNVAADDDDFLIVPQLLAHTTDIIRTISLNEVAGAVEPTFSLELTNHGAAPQNIGGYVIAASTPGVAAFIVGAQTLPPGGLVAYTETQLGFRPVDGDRLFLYAPGQVAVVDGIEVKNNRRARSPDGTGAWLRPNVATPGAANSFALHDDVVINEIMYHHRPILGTPGTPDTFETTVVVPIDQTWKFLAAGGDPGTAWRAVGFDDSTWMSGQGLLGFETTPQNLPEPLRRTIAPAVRSTYYFRTTFPYNGSIANPNLQLRTVIDDGAVIYLNGTEIFRLGVAAGPVGFSTPSNRTIGDAAYEGPFPLTIPPSLLFNGTNTLAVEVHQQATSSTDMILGLELSSLGNLIPGTPATPLVEVPEEWIELYNRSGQTVDLTGWKLDGGIDYAFPPSTTLGANEYLVVAKDAAAFQQKYPGIAVVGNYSGELNNRDDRIVLEDAVGNPADEVRYFDGGRWPEEADGGGSSLELRDPDADNAQAESWAASDEGGKSAWATYSYRGKAAADIGPTNFNELIVGLLDSGEVLLDDISVIADPDGTPRQLIQNGSFSSGAASTWRLLGNHGHSAVVPDPTNPANPVLRLVSTGQTEHMSNHLETTLKDGAALHTISGATTYEISFRAKWIGGSRQLRTNLYFNRLPKVTAIAAPVLHGTPGAANSTRVANVGPTYTDFAHGPVVPSAGESVAVTAAASDPDGVSAMTLYYSVAGGAWTNVPMSQAGGRYVGTIPGQAAAAIVQFYVEGQDALGAVSAFPAAGAESRALYKVQDGLGQPGGPHDLRIIMTPADAALLHANSNLMSNDHLGATVVYDENEVYYDVGVRLKGTPYGRPVDVFVSYDVSFNPEQKFRGVHDSIGIDRSARGPVGSPNVDEIVIRHVANHAGGIANVYDDIVRVITPLPQHTSVAILKLDTYGSEWLDSYFDNGGDNAVHEFDGAYYFTRTTDGNPESPKIVEPGPISYTDIRDLGGDKESYRRNWRTTNRQAADEYDHIIALNKAFALSGTALDAAIAPLMDVDQWMRHYALLSLVGIGDTYTFGNPHNLRVYQRPTDDRIVSLPHDMDVSFSRATTASLWGDPSWNLVKIITRPHNLRLFLGHLDDLIDTTYNTSYMSAWTSHYGTLAGSNFSAILSYLGARASYVQSQLPVQIPAVPFNITTNGGNGFTVDDVTATVEGDGWINVRTIRLAGSADPLDVTWTDQNSWRAIVPVDFGSNPLTLEAFDFQGNPIGSDSIAITSTVSARPLQDFLRITELMYHPDDPSPAELAAGFGDADDFEFVELRNMSAATTLDLSGASFSNGIGYLFGADTLASGAYAVIVADRAAFELRYGSDVAILGEYTGQLSNGGEQVRLDDADGVAIHDFLFDDLGPAWHPTTDGAGFSLVKLDAASDPASWSEGSAWRPSFESGGSPGARDVMRGDLNLDDRVDLLDLGVLQSHFGIAAGATRADGDISGDGAVSRIDVALLAANYGRSYPSTNAVSGSPSAASQASAVFARSAPRVDSRIQPKTMLYATARRRTEPGRGDAQPLASLVPSAVDEILRDRVRRERTPSLRAVRQPTAHAVRALGYGEAGSEPVVR